MFCSLSKTGMKHDEMFEEIPLVIRNSNLVNTLLCKLDESLTDPEQNDFLSLARGWVTWIWVFQHLKQSIILVFEIHKYSALTFSPQYVYWKECSTVNGDCRWVMSRYSEVSQLSKKLCSTTTTERFLQSKKGKYLYSIRSVLRRQSRDTNLKYKKVGVLPIRIV